MDLLCDELRIEIFKFVNTPISLSLANHAWYNISQDPHARAKWLLNKYGRAHALFHAVRLGDNFLTMDVLQSLLAKKAILSRYFIQRLFAHYGKYDQKLLELKVIYNADQISADIIRSHKKKPLALWGSNISFSIVTKIMLEAIKLFPFDIMIKGNDMELFHFLSAGPLAINIAPLKLQQNLKQIKDLIIKKNFIPFPPCPKSDTLEYPLNYIRFLQERDDDYPRKDGYENYRQLNIIARAIILHPELTNLWKRIGYYDICQDLNQLVIEGFFISIFPNNPPPDWKRPDESTIINRLKDFTDRGFRITNDITRDIFLLLEHKLPEIGQVLVEVFKIINKKSGTTIDNSITDRFSRLIYSEKKNESVEISNEVFSFDFDILRQLDNI
jgi:hypothetical protein